ncbi:MAG: DUF1446 domain-containing protein [Planctomycetes bacterium]|nr:DUF1446 domain-containing protein [Planctomycetota bacterium]
MDGVLRVGNAGGFWGDRIDAAAELVRQQPDLDYLTIDYLAEVSMSILARQRDGDPGRGYAADFLESLRLLAPAWKATSFRAKLITNAGGLNPMGCARAAGQVLRDYGCDGRRIAVVTGDDVLELIRSRAASGANCDILKHLETGESIEKVLPDLVTANVYLGAMPIVEALRSGADIVITGRVADPSLTVAPCIAHFGWSDGDYDRIAAATVAGHLIECGTQATGGISTDWLSVPDRAHIGFPIVQVDDRGILVVAKPKATGGRVDELTVKEQLLYEIGDPARYLSPDATVSFLGLAVEDLGGDRVRVSGAAGSPSPDTYKVSATYRAGYRASGVLTICGRDARIKGQACAEIVHQRLAGKGMSPQGWQVECLGAGDAVPVARSLLPAADSSFETVLRISVRDPRREAVERFARELMPLVTAGPQGVTGYAEGRPRVHEVFGYWPCLIERSAVQARWEMLEETA